jgi:hypothetical protein
MKSCISKIRELIIKPVLYSLLSKNYKKWHLICGSIDAIETTQLAVDSYVCLDKDKRSYIGPHLAIYGLFQALYVQQDAVSHLCESMDIALDIKTQYPEVYEIRQLRNRGIGHPSKEGKMNSKHVMSIGNDSIRLYSYTETGESSYPEYKISDCIEKQNKSLSKILRKVIKKMRSMEKEHKDKYKQNKLRALFPSDPMYCCLKIFEATNLIETYKGTVPERFGHRISFALDKTKELIEAIEKFDREINKRELQDDDVIFVRIEIERSKYPLEKLKEYFHPGSKSPLNAQDARAYADSARIHILDIVKHAESLDYEYVRKR